ncbi:hypothetical protein EYC80_004108 [Monilinia laxa]|uniref:Uncharacterized protein n=1 Tax=Monilinia laxa TaxID=61186 RepID=A0A5N6KM39_MONLA|nr:hypothetical protein EYC80_004108 [Monilinia laxa]
MGWSFCRCLILTIGKERCHLFNCLFKWLGGWADGFLGCNIGSMVEPGLDLGEKALLGGIDMIQWVDVPERMEYKKMACLICQLSKLNLVGT